MDHFPVPVGHLDARLGGQLLRRRLQFPLLRLAEGGGDPPDCSKINAAGPPSPKAAAHLPMVWGSRPIASAVAAAVQLWASSQRACHLSLSRGVGARIIRLCKSLASISHCSRNRSISLTPITIPSLTTEQANTVFHNSTPSACAFHLGFGLVCSLRADARRGTGFLMQPYR